MTQLVLNIENPKDVKLMRQLISKMEGVSIARPKRKNKSGLEEALQDVAAGRVYHASSVEDLFQQLEN
ncbi:MAG: hypothetical protein LUC85_05790 [Bacteroidales bacterium]|nr:hypothetical protein [Bacteroidales bacterium]MCD8394328.1 hypothetical protein [Bacteroidales bacterium]